MGEVNINSCIIKLSKEF